MYDKHLVDGIIVYIDKEAKVTGDPIKIELAKHSSDLADKDFDVIGLEA